MKGQLNPSVAGFAAILLFAGIMAFNSAFPTSNIVVQNGGNIPVNYDLVNVNGSYYANYSLFANYSTYAGSSDYWDALDDPDDIISMAGFYNKTQADARYLFGNYSETDPLWSGNASSVAYTANQGTWNVNSSNYWDALDTPNDIVSMTNFYNKTDSDGRYLQTESDPRWSANYSLVAFLANQGTWNVNSSDYWDGLDNPNAIISMLNFYNKTDADGRYLQTESDPYWTGNSSLVAYIANVGNWNVNSSNYWDSLNTPDDITSMANFYNKTDADGRYAKPGTCSAGQVVQNTTTGGVQCVTPLFSETDPYWSGNSSTVARNGTCPTGYVVQNTTTGGVQCISILSTTHYPNATETTGGTNTTSNLTLLWYYDGATYNITEGNGASPLTTYINYTNVTTFSQWVIREYYLGSASHHIQFQIWDYGSSTWENYYDIVGQSNFSVLTLPVYDPADHISGGVVQTRLNHPENGVATHRLYIDFAWLVEGPQVGASTDLTGYAKYNFAYNNFAGNGTFTTTSNITGAYLAGVLNWTNLTGWPASCSANQWATAVGNTLTCSQPSTTNITEGTNLYYTNARAREAISVSGGTGHLAYDNSTGVLTYTHYPHIMYYNVTEATLNSTSNSVWTNALSFPLTNGAHTSIECILLVDTSVSQTGFFVQTNFTGTESQRVTHEYWLTTTMETYASTSAVSNSAPASGLTSMSPYKVYAHAISNATGTFRLDFRSETGNQVNMYDGSWCRSIED